MKFQINSFFLNQFLYRFVYILFVPTILLACDSNGNLEKEYYKENPENFMLSVLDNNTDLYRAIKQDWFSSFKQDEKNKYDLFVTDEYIILSKDSVEVRIVNACLLVIDEEDDYFMGSEDYLCYRIGKEWNARWVKSLTEKDIKLIKSLNCDLFQGLDNHVGKKFFKAAKGIDEIEKNAIIFCQEAANVLCGKTKGNPLDYVSNKTKAYLMQDENETKTKGLFPQIINHNEELISSVYSSKLLLTKNKTRLYGCKMVMGVCDSGSSFYSIYTEKFVVAISDERIYLVASDQINMLDEELSFEEKQKIVQF